MLSGFPCEVEGLILEFVSDIVKKRNGRFVMQLNKKTDARFAMVAPLSCHDWDIKYYQRELTSIGIDFNRNTNAGRFTIRYYDANLDSSYDNELQSFSLQSVHYGFVEDDSFRSMFGYYVSIFRYKDGSVREKPTKALLSNPYYSV
jgi:hypothetical protein